MTTPASAYWSTRHRTFGDGWCERYWNAIDQPHRRLIVEALHRLPSWTSLVEIGCHVGINLRLIHEAFPATTLTGFDINEAALVFGREHLSNVTFTQADLYTLPLADNSVDVIVSSYALAYVSPTALPIVLNRLRQACRVGLVLAEPFGPERRVEGLDYDEWTHDYPRHLTGTTVRLISPPIDRLNALFVWIKPCMS